LAEPKANNNGFLLLEVLLSIFIIATTLIVINRAFSTSLKAVRLAGSYLLGHCVLEDKIFDIQIKESFADTGFSDTVQLGKQQFFYTMNISPVEITKGIDADLEELPLKRANLSVNWSDTDTAGRLNISTYVWEKKEEEVGSP